MYATIIEMNYKPGSTEEATALALAMRPDLAGIDGIKQFLIVDKGDDTSLLVAMYDTEAQREAAGPKGQELLGRVAHLFAEAPERLGGPVLVNEIF
jgi:hypothetical protein